MKTTLSPIQQERLRDLIELSNHGGRDQWHGLRCHHINNGQFTATYSDIAARWGVKPSAVYSTIKKFVKLGLITVERFERATLFTINNEKQTIEPIEANRVAPVAHVNEAKQSILNRKIANNVVPRLPRKGRKRKAIFPQRRRFTVVQCRPRKNNRRY